MIGLELKTDRWYFAMIRDLGACLFQVVAEEQHHLSIAKPTFPMIEQQGQNQIITRLRKWPGVILDWTKSPLHIPREAISCLARASDNLANACDEVWSLVRPATPDETNRLRHLSGGNGKQ